MGKVVKIVAGLALVAVAALVPPAGLLGLGVITGGSLIAIGASLALSALAPRPKIPESQLSRLNVQMNVGAPRKAVFGTTAFPLDLRYHEATGTDQEFIHYIIAHAAHKVQSIDEIWFEQDLAWTSSGGVQSKYSGYLTVTTRTEGAAGNEIAISGNWGAGERLTGCAYTYIRVKRTGNSKKSESPLVQGLPSRVTVIGEGAFLYDPRLDSTVTGGSGAHRADDQATWGASYSPADSYDSPALQLLFWLLGWKINGKLSIGCGVPPERIDLESFIEAANICDESIALSGGGTQERYRSSGTASDADDRMAVIDTLLTAMNGTLRDTGGKLSLTVIKNDLADYVLDLDDNDLLNDFAWQQTRGLSESYNVVRGRFVDPSNNSLYQMVDYPEVSITSPDGIERVLSLDLAYVEEGRRAQRIAKQVLQRNQYRGTFEGVFSAKALGCEVGEVVRLSLETLGWSNKLFRVISKQVRMDGQVPLTLLEENAAIYAWDAEESAVVTSTAPTVYDPLNSPFILADGLNEDAITAAQADATQALADALAAQNTADSKIEVFYQSGTPTSITAGDLWFKTDTQKWYIADIAGADAIATGEWELAEDSDIGVAITNAATAQATADGKVATYLDENEPFPVELLVGDPVSDSPSLSMDFTASFGDGDVWFTPDTKLISRWNADLAQWDQSLGDITKTVRGAANLILDYDSGGTLTTSTPLASTYSFAPAGGAALTSGVTWSVDTVLVGSQTDGDIWSGTVPSITGSGLAQLAINSGLKVAEAEVEVSAQYAGVTYPPFTVTVKKVLAAPTPEAGSDFDSTSLNGETVTGTTFTEIAALTVTTKTGSTDVDLTANSITIYPPGGVGVSTSNLQLKWQYESAPSTWTDIGSAADSDPDPYTTLVSGFYVPSLGSITCDRNQASLTASTEYNFRLMARVSSGDTAKTFSFAGTVSAQG